MTLSDDTQGRDACRECNGTGQPNGVMGGPEHGLCSYCGGSGRIPTGGRGEAVAWRWKRKGRTDVDAWHYQHGYPDLPIDQYDTERVYNAPQPPTKAMDIIERAAAHLEAHPAPAPGPAVTICDCELSHNGMGRSGRECDCMDENTETVERPIRERQAETLGPEDGGVTGRRDGHPAPGPADAVSEEEVEAAAKAILLCTFDAEQVDAMLNPSYTIDAPADKVAFIRERGNRARIEAKACLESRLLGGDFQMTAPATSDIDGPAGEADRGPLREYSTEELAEEIEWRKAFRPDSAGAAEQRGITKARAAGEAGEAGDLIERLTKAERALFSRGGAASKAIFEAASTLAAYQAKVGELNNLKTWLRHRALEIGADSDTPFNEVWDHIRGEWQAAEAKVAALTADIEAKNAQCAKTCMGHPIEGHKRWVSATAFEASEASAAALRTALANLAEAARNACDAKQHTPLIEALFNADQLIGAGK